MTIQKQEAEQREYILQEEKDQLIETDDLDTMKELIAASGDECVVENDEIDKLRDFWVKWAPEDFRLADDAVKKERMEKEIIENYFANEKLCEITWKEWNNMKESLKDMKVEYSHDTEKLKKERDDLEHTTNRSITRYNDMEKEMELWKKKFRDAGTLNRDMGFKIKVLEEYAFDGGVDSVRDFIDEKNGQIYEDGDLNIMDGFHWAILQDAETNEPHLEIVKNKVSQIQKWEELQSSGDADPEYLINAIAEKFGLKPINWGQDGCYAESACLWDKIMDEVEER